jgi:hypothetical protein
MGSLLNLTAATPKLLTLALMISLAGCGGGSSYDATEAANVDAASVAPAAAPTSDLRLQALSVTSAPAVQASDVLFNVSSATPLAQRTGMLQCLATQPALKNLAASLYGPDGAGGSELKYGWVADPANSGRTVSYMAIRSSDVDTAGAGNKRCEYTFPSPAIPWNKDFWFTTAVRTGNLTGSTDQQAVWQWHEKSDVSGLPPYLSAVVSGQTMSIYVRSNQNSAFSKVNTSTQVVYKSTNWTANTWNKFVVQAKLDSQQNGSSYVRIWLNGVQIVNRVGPMGYLYANPTDYVKTGLYHPTGSGNSWSVAVDKREVWLKGPAMVMDRGGYTPEMISALID